MKRILSILALILAIPVLAQERTPDLAPVASDVGPTRATITWSSKSETLGKIEFGTSERLGQSQEEPEPRASHKIVLEGLEPDTCYYYRVVSGADSSRIEILKTPPIAFHVGPYLQLPTPTSMTIMWETNDLLDGEVEYGPTEALGQRVSENAGPTRLHQVTLKGLQPGRTYHYRVRSATAASGVHQFRTAPLPGTPRWRAAVYGDSRSNPDIHARVVEQIAKANVDLIIHTGDIVLDGRNYASWRREWFAPLAPIRATVPWVSTIGNHERDSVNYFSYAALPGNQRYFRFQYGNAQIVCLDSNSWIQQGREGLQYQWMEKTLRESRDDTWMLVAFHHPLFSAHRTRPIINIRWQWAPLLLDPATRVDLVLNGHDHFYARNYPMARVGDGPVRGVQFLTSAGGGANLYPIRQRDYVEKVRAVHHFTLLEFDGARIQGSAIDLNGNVFDRFEVTKQATPPDQLVAYEVEELKETLRKALASAAAVQVEPEGPSQLNTTLEVPHAFQVPVAGVLRWQAPPGWSMPHKQEAFTLKPNQPFVLRLEAMVEPAGLAATPMLTIEFEPGSFRNRAIECYPFKLTGPKRVSVTNLVPMVDGQLEDSWQRARAYPLVPGAIASGRVLGSQSGVAPAPSTVRLAIDGERLIVAARLRGPTQVQPRDASKTGSRLLLTAEHFRVELHDGQKTHAFVISPEHVTYHSVDGKAEDMTWPAAATAGEGCWMVEMALPLALFKDRQAARINAIQRTAGGQELELRPSFTLGSSPDLIPDWKPGSTAEQFAALEFPR